MIKNLKQPDYSNKTIKGRELIKTVIEGLSITGVLSYFFYRSLLAFLILLPIVYFYYLFKCEENNQKRKQDLIEAFKDTVSCINSSLQAGYSLENAFISSYDEISSLYGKEKDISQELLLIRIGLENGRPLLSLLNDFAIRSGEEDIRNLVMILTTGKQMGGNIVETISSYVGIMEEKTSLNKEIDIIISSRKYEMRIMSVIPFVIIFYVDITNKGFISSLYKNVTGIIIMSVLLIVYLVAFLMAERMMKIRV